MVGLGPFAGAESLEAVCWTLARSRTAALRAPGPVVEVVAGSATG